MKKSQGFTIVELMIASTVFSVILLVATTAVISIGKVYQKTTIINKTQFTARSVMDTISQSIQFEGGLINIDQIESEDNPYFCIGNKRFRFVLNKKLSDNISLADESSFVLKRDTVINCNDSTDIDPVELLQPNMRLLKLVIFQNAENAQLYTIQLIIAHGPSDLFGKDASGNDVCLQAAGSEQCYISSINTTVQKRVQ